MFAERKLSSFDGAQSTRFAAFSSTHRSICLDYWHLRLQKNINRKGFLKVDLCGSPQFVRVNCIQVRAASGYITVFTVSLAQERSLRNFRLHGV